MASRKLAIPLGLRLHTHFPHIQGNQYVVGLQMRKDGETKVPVNHGISNIPWPTLVQPLKTLASHAGIPRERGLAIVNNSTASLPENWLFMSGFSGKSKG